MKTVDPALAEDTALEPRPSKGGNPVLQVLRERRSALLGLFSTHPPTEQRIQALMAPPR